MQHEPKAATRGSKARHQDRRVPPLKPAFREGGTGRELRSLRRLLGINIRPITVDDMAPGYAYEPDLTMFEIAMPATPDQAGALWQMPVHVPKELREPTIENARAVYALLYSTDPQARAIIDDLCARARPIRESPSGFNGPREYLGQRWLPPTNPTPPNATAPTSTTSN